MSTDHRPADQAGTGPQSSPRGERAPSARSGAAPRPAEPADRTRSTVALGLAAASLLAPVGLWVGVNAVQTVSSGAFGVLVLLMLVSCGAAVVAFVMGIMSRADGRGVLAIVLGVLGGLVSFGSLAMLGLAAAFAGMSAGL